MASLQNGSQEVKQPIVYVSKETHCSVKRLADVHNLKCVEIKTRIGNASMDAQDLEEALLNEENRSQPALVVPTIGTTMSGAIDDITEITRTLKKLEF